MAEKMSGESHSQSWCPSGFGRLAARFKPRTLQNAPNLESTTEVILDEPNPSAASTSQTQTKPQKQTMSVVSFEPDTAIQHRANLKIFKEPFKFRKTSIICTIGPKTSTVEMIAKLREAGMNIVRMNFSHGSYEYHGSVVINTRKSVEEFPLDGSPVSCPHILLFFFSLRFFFPPQHFLFQIVALKNEISVRVAKCCSHNFFFSSSSWDLLFLIFGFDISFSPFLSLFSFLLQGRIAIKLKHSLLCHFFAISLHSFFY
jgi:hypothetical protein